MPRTSYIQINGKLIPKDEYYAMDVPHTHFIRGDYQPYQSMVTGEMIEGRRAHREHLKTHNVVEAHDMPITQPSRPSSKPDERLKEIIARQVYEKIRY